MRLRSRACLPPLAILFATTIGCADRSLVPDSNQSPETTISEIRARALGEGELEVALEWAGQDPDGMIDHYEIAWDEPVDWIDVRGTAQSFVVPDPASSKGELRTIYVRAVDDAGAADETPAHRSFGRGGIAPWTMITFGPADLGFWGPNVEFEWVGKDEDGFVVAYRYALVTLDEWRWDFAIADSTVIPVNMDELIAWVDTLTYRPQPDGSQGDSVWVTTEADSVLFPELPETNSDPFNGYLFVVRAIDDAGIEEEILDRGINTRFFNVSDTLGGPRLAVHSDILGSWGGSWFSGDPPLAYDVFHTGVRFEWNAAPGQSGTQVAGFSFAVDDTTNWSPFSLDTTSWPANSGGEVTYWFPELGPHTLFVRAIDEAGLITVVEARILVFPGPGMCPNQDRYVLVVLDTNVDAMIADAILPLGFKVVMRGLAEFYFEDYRVEFFETDGLTPPPIDLLACASSVFWFHSADLDNGDDSILQSFHQGSPNPLVSYVESGGNFFLCGVQPSQALRYFPRTDIPVPQLQTYPLLFQVTIGNPDFLPHWAANSLGIERVSETVGNTIPASLEHLRLRTCRSEVTGGGNPYPDLEFDPLTWPQGPKQRGFGFYDRGIEPLTDIPELPPAEVLYTANDEGVSIGIRRRATEGPGINGNVVVLGFHPYFLDRPAGRAMIEAVLADFGEKSGLRKTSAVMPD
jgi:hypothetical protein